ncbi:helix-turn-helix domain-containing protein [Longispora albida]|uniref:helix-turn-helix domain-containing protein n=1 Tax=Longispora albida TaxID=203523 RepID=UPI000381C81B|nr:helix-turn-helix transcriptional regulator [Longispora albida]
MATSPTSAARVHQIGAALRELRESTGLSGSRVAARTGISQSKISKIENGLIRPTAGETARLLSALGASEETKAQIVEQAQAAQVTFTTIGQYKQLGLDRHQHRVAAWEGAANELHHLSVALVSGLLQSPAYIRGIFAMPAYRDRPDAEAAVAGRLERQKILHEPDRVFNFVLMESALRHRIVSAPDMADQADHLVAMSRLPQIRISVLPMAVRLPTEILHAFSIFDRDWVLVETSHGDLKSLRPEDTRSYLERFELLQGAALQGDDVRAFLGEVAAQYRADVD